MAQVKAKSQRLEARLSGCLKLLLRIRPRARCHSPRKRGIQYAAAYRFNHNCLGILDRPVKPGDDSGGARSSPAFRPRPRGR
ncbi:hypothetical protein E4K65_09565 [Bradyrhizobium niftali]|uniref:Transposase n=1 Tax=Bradyrhizobium niftali TaxID=2560055 RepID=A0A4Y9M206_9BRAD|nr:hypothetical protein E4K65_09565 [Bradyrhizobium niftali]